MQYYQLLYRYHYTGLENQHAHPSCERWISPQIKQSFCERETWSIQVQTPLSTVNRTITRMQKTEIERAEDNSKDVHRRWIEEQEHCFKEGENHHDHDAVHGHHLTNWTRPIPRFNTARTNVSKEPNYSDDSGLHSPPHGEPFSIGISERCRTLRE